MKRLLLAAMPFLPLTSAAAPETNCIAAMPRRGFVLPDGTTSVDAAR